MHQKFKKISCNTDKHFREDTNQSIENFDVQITVQLEKVPCDKNQSRKRRKQFEGYCKNHYARLPYTDLMQSLY